MEIRRDMYRDLNRTEAEIAKIWDEQDHLDASEKQDGRPDFVFYEGPPTANGRPGIHHMISRTLKDSVLRYKSMNGYRILRKAGWDTHGLPVEIAVEKQLGLQSKKEIEEYGIAKFNELCRKSVFEYEAQWRQMSHKMGYLIDLDHPYITLDNNYIETVWWLLDQFNKKGMIYDGHKIMPYCTRCGTGLASHEVAQGYKEIKTTTVFVKFKITGAGKSKADVKAGDRFLVWTTTPWTLPSNVALAVNPNETYIKIRPKAAEAGKDGCGCGHDHGHNAGCAEEHMEEHLIVEKTLAPSVLEGEYEVLSEYRGSELEGIEYEQLIPGVSANKKAFFVTLADYVTTDSGTGIVHIAPAFGEDDYQVGQKYDLPVLQPINLEGVFTETPWKGMKAMDADPVIIEYLYDNGLLYRRQKMEHNYPHCWRCGTPLLYYANSGWFIEMSKIADKLVAENDKVNWQPSYVGEKRFGNWLENLNDWALSRSRYWGTPLNIWTCECGHFETVGSRAELREKAIEDVPEDIELHRPYVDEIHFKCPKCGKTMSRVTDVIDCWFDSGSMPFAQRHYPFENKEVFENQFPADFICEGIDQTRGWFYSLLAISVFITGRAPYKNVLVNDLILDKNGKKMSKSQNNTVDPFEVMEKYTADWVRWYLLYSNPAWLPKKFDEEMLVEIGSKYFGTLRNLYNFFTLYANTDGIDAKALDSPYEKHSELDMWLLSKLNGVIAVVTEAMNGYDHMKSVRALQNFVVEDLSNWYIRRSRRRFWGSEMTEDKTAVFRTTYEVLVAVARLTAPFAPFLADEIYMNLTGEESVHLSKFPVVDAGLINENTERRMDLVRDLVSLGRSARESVKLKVRQPLAKAIVDGRHRPLIEDLAPLVMEELNVKEVVFEDDLPKFMDFSLKPNFKELGPRLGSRLKDLSKALAGLDQGQTALRLEDGGSIELGDLGEFTKDDILIGITAKEGYTVRLENNNFILLDTHLTQDLIDEGYARELVSKIQQERKAQDLDVADRIEVVFDSDDEFAAAVEKHCEYIMAETLADSCTRGELSGDAENLNGKDVRFSVAKK